MSVAEAPVKPIFGQITAEQMASNEALARHVLGVVQKVCRHSKGRLTVEAVARGLRSGDMLLYGVLRPKTAELEATVVAQIRDGVFEILVAGPHFADVAPFMPALEKIAGKLGCASMTTLGPSFFEGHLPEGWFIREVRYERRLGDAG